jgi:TatD DNase family protein
MTTATARQGGAEQLVYTLGDRLYLNVTNGCSLKCRFCLKNRNSGPQVGGYHLGLNHQPRAAEIMRALPDNLDDYPEVVFCGYGEPTLRLPTVLEVAEKLRKRGQRVRLNTDGLCNRVFRRDMTPQIAAQFDAVSVSLNAADSETYNYYCQPPWADAYDYVLDFIAKAAQRVPRVTATAIEDLPGVDLDACRELAENRGATFFSRPQRSERDTA